nr:hypothetical protein [Anabaena sphaerica]
MTFLGIITQLTTAYVYLGIAEGALAVATEHTRSSTRPENIFGITSIKIDGYFMHSYGQLWTELQAAIALADQAAIQVQQGWEQDIDLNIPLRKYGRDVPAERLYKGFKPRTFNYRRCLI